MLQLTAFEFIVRAIPEAFIIIFAGYILSNKELNIKRYLISSILLAISTFFIRMLPINYGVHTILSIIIQIILLVYISKIDMILAMKSSIILTICLFIVELLNMLVLNIILKEKLESIMINPIPKTIYGLPSLFGFAFIIFGYYYLRKKGKSKNDKN
ncbi:MULTISPECIES: hypothetical protein [unclassified Clostridium]|uniref:hypothetical protein n=1 Tax=unclassified Clostridium TaxID=2614128 RepID=UPI00029732A6|nr:MULTISPECIES: hypothetical protein [unclassified Clostridium]EKQ51720.1 MAG: hypothetical protein A370_04705 [Clostridium sp. Maddingley MBC34-26]